MNFKREFLSLCFINTFIMIVIADNNITADEIEKRRSVREFFDSLVAGSSNQNSKSTQNSNSQGTTPRPQEMPILMPYAVPMHSPPPPPPPVPMGPPTYGYPSGMYRAPPPPPPPRHIGFGPIGPPTPNYGPVGQPNAGFAPIPHMVGSPTQNYGIVSPHNHYDYGQHSRPIAIAIPVPLHAIPLPYNSHPDETHRPFSSQHNYLSNNDFTDGMSASTKYTLFADPFDDSDEDLFDSSNRRFKVIPVEMNESNYGLNS